MQQLIACLAEDEEEGAEHDIGTSGAAAATPAVLFVTQNVNPVHVLGSETSASSTVASKKQISLQCVHATILLSQIQLPVLLPWELAKHASLCIACHASSSIL